MAATLRSPLSRWTAALGSLPILAACAFGGPPLKPATAPSTPQPSVAPRVPTTSAAPGPLTCGTVAAGRPLALAMSTAPVKPKQRPALQRTLQELGQATAQWDAALKESGFSGGLQLLAVTTMPPAPLRRGSQRPPCPNPDTIFVHVSAKGVRFAPATLRPAQWRGWPISNEPTTTAALLLAYIPRMVGAQPSQILMTERGAFAGLRPVRVPPGAVDTTGQTVAPATTAAVFALPMLSPTDSVEVRASRQQLALLHFTGGGPTGRSVVRETRVFPRAHEPAEWRPAQRTQTYPLLKWGWTPVGDTVVVAASLSRPGTERVLRTLTARQP